MRVFLTVFLLAATMISAHAQAPTPDSLEFDKVFTKVPMTAEFKGGQAAWIRFLANNLRYPKDSLDNEYSGAVTVKFVISQTGKISQVEVTSKVSKALAAEVTRVMTLSDGKWTPAIACGRMVKSYKTITINVLLAE